MTRPTAPGWWWGAYGECPPSPTLVDAIDGHLVADDGATERRVDDSGWTWVAPVAPPVTPLDKLIALCQRLELPLTLAWHPDAEAPGLPGTGWTVEVNDLSHYGRLEDAVAKHLDKLRVRP